MWLNDHRVKALYDATQDRDCAKALCKSTIPTLEQNVLSRSASARFLKCNEHRDFGDPKTLIETFCCGPSIPMVQLQEGRYDLIDMLSELVAVQFRCCLDEGLVKYGVSDGGALTIENLKKHLRDPTPKIFVFTAPTYCTIRHLIDVTHDANLLRVGIMGNLGNLEGNTVLVSRHTPKDSCLVLYQNPDFYGNIKIHGRLNSWKPMLSFRYELRVYASRKPTYKDIVLLGS